MIVCAELLANANFDNSQWNRRDNDDDDDDEEVERLHEREPASASSRQHTRRSETDDWAIGGWSCPCSIGSH